MLTKESVKNEEPSVDNYKRILVAYDGSSNANRALQRAALVSSSTGASVRVLVVVNLVLQEYGPVAVSIPESYVEQMLENGQKLLDQAVQSCTGLAKDVSGLVEQGYPSETILEVAKREDTDLVVLGRRGISGLRRFLLGGVSSAVVNQSACDVLIVK